MPSDSRISNKLTSFIQRSDKKPRTTTPTSSAPASSSIDDAVTLSGSSRVEKNPNKKRRLLGWRSKPKEGSNSPKDSRSVRGSADNSPRVSQDNQRSSIDYSQPTQIVPYTPTPSTASGQRTSLPITATSSNPERSLASSNSLTSTAIETDPEHQTVNQAIDKYNAALQKGPVVFTAAQAKPLFAPNSDAAHLNNFQNAFKTIDYTVAGKPYQIWKTKGSHFKIDRTDESDIRRPGTPFTLEKARYRGYSKLDARFADDRLRSNYQSAHLKTPSEAMLQKAEKAEMDTLQALLPQIPKGFLTQANLLQQ
jgi:hypothetical protein